MSFIKIAGKEDKVIEERIEGLVSERTADGSYSVETIDFIKAYQPNIKKISFANNAELLESFRMLCSMAETDFLPKDFTSHRKFVGPIIAFAKNFVFRIFRFFLKDYLRDQRRFNSQVVKTLANICNNQK